MHHETDIILQLSAQRRSIWRWTKRILIGAASLILFFCMVGASYQFLATRADMRKYPPPGQMVDVGGYRLHLHCVGKGSPTVVMESGLGETSLDWELVQPEVAQFTSVCTYDRAGYGWSDSGPGFRTGDEIARELHTLLMNAGITGPYVLVGHSLGGMYVRILASRYPDDVAGMVLVDATHENMWLKPEFPKPAPSVVSFYLGRLLAQLGVLRLLRQPVGDLYLSQKFSLATREMAEATGYRSQAVNSALSEVQNIERSMAQSRAFKSFDNKPLIVLIHGVPDKTSVTDNQRREQAWQELQAELASRSTNSKQIVAPKSRHFILFDQPDVVIDAIRQVVEAVRQGTQLKSDNKRQPGLRSDVGPPSVRRFT